MKQLECHKCPFNNLSSDVCISCAMELSVEQYSYPYSKNVFDFVDPVQQEVEEPRQCTSLPEDLEDRFRIALAEIFQLSPLELLCFQGIMQRKTLTEIAKELGVVGKKLSDGCSRFRAFQIRKAIAKKLPRLKTALQTSGQRKELKR